MKTFLASVALMLCCLGCSDMSETTFVYFNLSPKEIFVDSVAGLPPGHHQALWFRFIPMGGLQRRAQLPDGETVRVPPTLKISWKEGGSSHQAELKRDEVGIPAKIKKGKISFTYLGDDKWRVKVLDM